MKFDVGLLAERSPSPSGRRENWNLGQSSDRAGNSFCCGDVSHRRNPLARPVPQARPWDVLLRQFARKIIFENLLREFLKIHLIHRDSLDCNFYSRWPL